MALRINVISGLVLILMALAAWHEVAPLEIGTLKYFGPGMLPRLLSILLFVAGVFVLIAGIFQKSAAAEYFRASLRGPLMIALALAAFAGTIQGGGIAGARIPQLGLVVAGPLAVILAGYASPEANFRDLSAVAFGLTAACTALFNDLLGTTIPILPSGLENAVVGWISPETASRAAYAAYAVIAVLIVVCFPISGGSSHGGEGANAHD